MSTSLIVEDRKEYFPAQLILGYRVFIGFSCLAIGLYFLLRRDLRLKNHLQQFGGPSFYPVIGNALSFISPHQEIFSLFDKWINKYGSIFCIWLGNFHPYVFIAEPDAIEKILSSTVNIEKGRFEYQLAYDWLGLGLLTAPKQKWVHTRKLLTPTFHFKILSDFLPIFNNQASILLKCLERDSVDNGEPFDMSPYLTKLTTDIICETAMGKKLNAQTNSSHQKYCDAVTNYSSLIFNKTIRPWLRIPLLNKLTSTYKAEKEYLKTLRELPLQVIRSKKREREQKKLCHENNNVNEEDDQATIFSSKQKKAFLDLLLDTSENSPETFTEQNVMEEVATFMFAGHDTTAVFFMWALHLLANHPECQEKLQQELDEIFSNDGTREVTLSDLADMKYLECCIKETLRIYPSAPAILRQIGSDIVLKSEKIIPRGVTAIISIYYTHRNPDYYEDPNAFKPERFLLENTVKRHPYSFIPFSAGPRNCIGQKYALMEAKVVLAKLLRTYWIEPVDKLETLRKLPHIVLRCGDGIRVKLHQRNNS